MGQKNDDKTRTQQPRVSFINLVKSARRCLYDLGYSIASQSIDIFLKPLSLMPTMVCKKYQIFRVTYASTYRMHSSRGLDHWNSTPILCLLLILCTSLNWASGNQLSSTFWEYWMQLLLVANCLQTWTSGRYKQIYVPSISYLLV